MDFLYRNIHMEQKKWDASTQITIEEDINIPELKGDCMSMLLKDATLSIDETRVGRDQVVLKGALQYQILYETEGGQLEQLSGTLPFEEIINVSGTTPGELAGARGIIEDFKVSMINTRKIAIQSVVMLYAYMHQLLEEEWTDDVVNAGTDLEKLFESREVLQLCQKKSDVFRVKEELELPGGYPAVQNLLWKHVSLGDMEARPMEGKVSLKGELNCFFIYTAQGAGQAMKMVNKKVPFHGMIECSICQSDMSVSVLPTLNQCTVEVKPDFDGEDRILYLEAALDLQIRIYSQEKIALLQDMYSTSQEITLEEKTVQAPVLHLAGDGKCKLKYSHRLKEGTPRAVQMLHSCGTVFPDREVWENDKLSLMGSVRVQMLYMTGEEEMPYAISECDVPYTLEMESSNAMGTATDGEAFGGAMPQKPTIMIEPRLEQLEAQLVDSEEMEVKGILAFSVLVFDSEKQQCIGRAECRPLDTAKFAALPSMVMCFAEKDTPLWEYGKRYYMPVEEIKRLNNMSGDCLKAGSGMLLVKGAR